MHTLLKSRNKTEPLVLAHQLIRAASALPQVVQRGLHEHYVRPDTDDSILGQVFNAAERSTALLFAGFGRVTKSPDGAQVQGHVIYEYVRMYSRLVESLETIPKSELRRSTGADSTSTSEKKLSPSKSKAKQAKPMNMKGNATLNLASNFLCNVIDRLDPKSDAHKALYEGFAYTVLNKLAPRLYLLVFGHTPGPTIADEIAISNSPDEIEDDTDSIAVHPEDLQLKAAKLEAPYLIHLLTWIMNAAPAYLGAAVGNKAGKSKQANTKGSLKGALAIHAKERLQRTLVNCMFVNEEDEEDDPFADCLKMPALNGAAIPMPKIKEAEVQDWFREEVWRLVGWEILSREGDW